MKKNALILVGLGFAVLMAACQAAPTMGGVAESANDGGSVESTDEPLPYLDDGDYEVEETEAPAEGEAFDQAGEAAEPAISPPIAAPTDMFFEDYGTNPFVSAAEDNLSTFAVDVDTGSYTLARQYLTDGYLPPSEQVRLEEFINYFNQDYPIPQDSAFGINLEAARTPFSAEDAFVLRVGVQGFDVPADQRPDATLIFVIDVSGSMEGPERLGAVKQALLTLTNQLRATDRIGIVVYGDTGRVVLQPTEVGQAGEVRDAINSLQSTGSTNAEEGLRLAYEMATEYFDEDGINRLILCSDGVANVGATGPDEILEIVRNQADEGITLTTVGFGMGNYNDVLMEQLADDGNGQYFYVDGQEEADRIFVNDLTGTLQTIALDAKIQVQFQPDTVQAYRLMGYENRDVADDDFRNDDVDAGEIGAGHSVTALYEIVPVAGAQGTVATVRLRWEDPESHEVTEIEQSIDMGRVSGFDQTTPRFQFAVAVAAFADLLGDGGWSQNTTYAQVYEVANAAASALGQDAEVQEFLQLVQRAEQLTQ